MFYRYVNVYQMVKVNQETEKSGSLFKRAFQHCNIPQPWTGKTPGMIRRHPSTPRDVSFRVVKSDDICPPVAQSKVREFSHEKR